MRWLRGRYIAHATLHLTILTSVPTPFASSFSLLCSAFSLRGSTFPSSRAHSLTARPCPFYYIRASYALSLERDARAFALCGAGAVVRCSSVLVVCSKSTAAHRSIPEVLTSQSVAIVGRAREGRSSDGQASANRETSTRPGAACVWAHPFVLEFHRKSR